MTIPFSPEELLARVLVIARRTLGDAVPFNPVQRLGELEIDILHRRVRAGSSELHLTGLEQSLLYLLAARAGRVVTRGEILDALWGVDYVSESNVVDRHVRNLRAKLQNDWRKPRFIATVPGQGIGSSRPSRIPSRHHPEPTTRGSLAHGDDGPGSVRGFGRQIRRCGAVGRSRQRPGSRRVTLRTTSESARSGDGARATG